MTLYTTERINKAPEVFNKLILGELSKQGITCWIAGGAVTDYLIGRIPNDFDIYFPNIIEFEKAQNYLENNGARLIYNGENGVRYIYKGKNLDLVKIFFESPKHTITYSDLSVCQVAVDEKGFFSTNQAIADIENKRARVVNVFFPESTLARLLKYKAKGFDIFDSDLNKLNSVTTKNYAKATGVSGQTNVPSSGVFIPNISQTSSGIFIPNTIASQTSSGVFIPPTNQSSGVFIPNTTMSQTSSGVFIPNTNLIQTSSGVFIPNTTTNTINASTINTTTTNTLDDITQPNPTNDLPNHSVDSSIAELNLQCEGIKGSFFSNGKCTCPNGLYIQNGQCVKDNRMLYAGIIAAVIGTYLIFK